MPRRNRLVAINKKELELLTENIIKSANDSKLSLVISVINSIAIFVLIMVHLVQ